MFLASDIKQKLLTFYPDKKYHRIEVFANTSDIPFRNCHVYECKYKHKVYDDAGRYFVIETIYASYIGEIKDFLFFPKKLQS